MSEDFNSILYNILFCPATLTLFQRISGFRIKQTVDNLNILNLLYSSPQSEFYFCENMWINKLQISMLFKIDFYSALKLTKQD